MINLVLIRKLKLINVVVDEGIYYKINTNTTYY